MAMTRRQALDFFHSDDLIGLGMEADTVRRYLHPTGVVTYTIERNISCSNEGFDFDAIHEKIAETVEMGGTGILLQSSFRRDLNIEWFEALLKGIRQRFPQ